MQIRTIDGMMDIMISKWYGLKSEAIKLRTKGLSIRKIETRLGIPRSTLSGWLKDIELTSEQKEKLLQDWKNALVKARKKAVFWHNAQKEKRLQEARLRALESLKSIDLSDKNILELALAMLYLGEGTKKSSETSMGNSDPSILKLFLAVLTGIYGINIEKLRCELHIRADQNPKEIKQFWAKELALPLENFKYVSVDKRTVGTKTYPHYKGVCFLRCFNTSIQRKLLYLGRTFSEQVIKNNQGN